MLTDRSRDALRSCYAARGKHKGRLLARCPDSRTLAAAAWQGAMLSVNPFKASVAAVLFMNEEQREVYHEVTRHFDAMPHDHRIMADRDREALENLGVW